MSMQSATIKMSVDDVQGAVGVALAGPLPPAAVLLLGARVAAAADVDTFVPDGILVDREGHLHLQQASLDPRFVAPEHQHLEDPPQTPTAVVWALGRHMLELSVGEVVDDAVLQTPTPERLAAVSDVDGRPLAPRLCDVLAAMLAPRPDERLQSLLPTTRVCITVAKTFGDGDVALRAAVTRQLTGGALKKTKDLPARAVLDAADVARLRGPQRPKTITAKTILIPEMKDIVPRLQAAPEACATETRTLRNTGGDVSLQSLGLPAPASTETPSGTVVDVTLQSLGGGMPARQLAAPPAAATMTTTDDPTEPMRLDDAPAASGESEKPRLVTADLEAPAPVAVAARNGRVMLAAIAGIVVVVALIAVAVR
jgi:hypothetical protein